VPDDVAKPGEINGDAFDRFTLAHLGAGAVLGLLGAPWWMVVVGALGWELLERPLKRRAPGMFPHSSQDTAQNAIVDAGAVLAGAAIVKAMVRR
jgi:hypothetical protein